MSLTVALIIDVDTGGKQPVTLEVYNENYTHNVKKMWIKAGVNNILYNSTGDKCGQHLEKLRNGLKHMQDNPAIYKQMNPKNGWGDYDTAMYFLAKFTKAVEENPNCIISSFC